MPKKLISAILTVSFIIIMVALIACEKDDTTNVILYENQVSIYNSSFSPATLTVPMGTTVTWYNQASRTHNVKPTGGSSFTPSRNFGQGGIHQYTFTTPGTYTYECTRHSSMNGTIIVQ